MATTQLYYVTNRRRQGRNRWQPTGYGPEPSKDGTENLRAEFLQDGCGFGSGNGKKFARYFFSQRAEANITHFPKIF